VNFHAAIAAVISDGSSGAPEKNWNDVRNHDLVTFLKLPNLTDGGAQHVDLPTSEKLANQGRTKQVIVTIGDI